MYKLWVLCEHHAFNASMANSPRRKYVAEGKVLAEHPTATACLNGKQHFLHDQWLGAGTSAASGYPLVRLPNETECCMSKKINHHEHHDEEDEEENKMTARLSPTHGFSYSRVVPVASWWFDCPVSSI